MRLSVYSGLIYPTLLHALITFFKKQYIFQILKLFKSSNLQNKMKFVFVIEDFIKRKLEHTYENYINNCGFSGTDGQILEMSNWLNKMGHNSIVVKDTELKNLKDINDIDIFCPSFYVWLPTVINFCKLLNSKTKILLYIQSFADCTQIFNLKLNIYIVGVSDYVKLYYYKYGYPYKTIYNAVNDEIFTNNTLDYESKKGNYVFFASYERGGEICLKIFNKLANADSNIKLHITSYEPNDINKISHNNSQNIITYSSLSKKEIKKLLDKCDYFIYPLVNNLSGSVHHDTFACVVLEALACGVSVISWNVACLKNLYKDNIYLIEPPPCRRYNPLDKFGCNINMLTEESINLFVNKINEIETYPELKLTKKKSARNWALTNTWENKTKELLEFIS
jgi:glycosyltransferase involved in cell wall biosynthesis